MSIFTLGGPTSSTNGYMSVPAGKQWEAQRQPSAVSSQVFERSFIPPGFEQPQQQAVARPAQQYGAPSHMAQMPTVPPAKSTPVSLDRFIRFAPYEPYNEMFTPQQKMYSLVSRGPRLYNTSNSNWYVVVLGFLQTFPDLKRERDAAAAKNFNIAMYGTGTLMVFAETLDGRVVFQGCQVVHP